MPPNFAARNFAMAWGSGETISPYPRGIYRGYIGIMEKKMETTIVYWGYIEGLGFKV